MYCLKYKDLYAYPVGPVAHKPLGRIHHGLSGEFKLILRDANGRILEERDWEKNTIMTPALDAWAGATDKGIWGMNQGFNYWTIGDGSTAVTQNDQYLDNQLAYASDFSSLDGYEIYNNDDPVGHYGHGTFEHKRFNAGVGTGTIREVGLASGSSGIVQGHWSRQLLGTPLVKGADNILDLYWKYRCYTTLAEDTGVVNIEGVDYNYIVKPRWSTGTGNVFQSIRETQNLSGEHGYYSTADCVWPSDYFTTVGGTRYSNYGGAWTNPDEYTAGDYHQSNYYSIGVDGVTSDDTIRAFWFYHYPADSSSRVQVYFDKVVGGGGVFKDIERTFLCETRVSWGRFSG